MSRLREECSLRSDRLQRLRQEQSELLQEQEQSLAALRHALTEALAEGKEAAEPPAEGQDGEAPDEGNPGRFSSSSSRASLLQREVRRLEEERNSLNAALERAKAAAAKSQQTFEEERAKADVAAKLYADLEEAADLAEEERYSGRRERTELLQRANETLRRQLQQAEQRCQDLQAEMGTG